jgi:hypothetical protein|tara:strand:+ start:200 stop:640 length:441 start_codon:yes stop_codon:yes gene_type:complete
MIRKNDFIGQLEKLLLHLKNSKLEYLKASDRINSPKLKRYFNLIATERNKFFQEILSLIQSFNISYDDLIIGRFNYDQLLISSIHEIKSSPFKKCIKSDEILLNIYNKIEEIKGESEIFSYQKNKIKNSLIKNPDLVNVESDIKKL